MPLHDAFLAGLLVGALLFVASRVRVGPEISRRLSKLSAILFGTCLCGLALTAQPLAAGAWAPLGLLVRAGQALVGLGFLFWGVRRWWRDREIDAGVRADLRDDPLSQVKRWRFVQQVRQGFGARRDAARHDHDAAVAAAAKAGRLRALTMVAVGVPTMLAPFAFASMREATLDGSPASLWALGFILVGVLLVMFGRRSWVRHTQREQRALQDQRSWPPD